MTGTGPVRGAPNPDRPRMSPEIERQLEPIDRKSAEGYAAAEEALEKIDELLGDAGGAVVAPMEHSDTLLHTLREIREAAKPEDK